MSKLKTKISCTIILMIGIIAMFVGSSFAETISSLHNKAKSGQLFDNSILSSVGQTIQPGDPLYGDLINQKNFACIGEMPSGRAGSYVVRNIIDVDLGYLENEEGNNRKGYPGTIKGYYAGGETPVYYASTGVDENSMSAIMTRLAVGAYVSIYNPNSSQSYVGTEKAGLRSLIYSNIGVLTNRLHLDPTFAQDVGTSKDVSLANWNKFEEKYSEIRQYSDTLRNYKFRDRTNNDEVTVDEIKVAGADYTRIGPYTISNASGNSITPTFIDTSKNNQEISVGSIWYSTSANPSSTSQIKRLRNETDGLITQTGDEVKFYIFLEGKRANQLNENIEIKLTKTLTNTYRARFIFLSTTGGSSQNYLIYDAVSEPSEYSITLNVPNTTGTLEIIKVVKGTSNKIKLAKIGFKIRCSDGKYLAEDSNGNLIYDASESRAKEWITTSKGRIVIENIKYGKYTAIETTNPYEEYKLNEGNTYDLVMDKQKNTYYIENDETDEPDEPEKGNLLLEKVDAKDTDKKLSGVKFTIRFQSASRNNRNLKEVTDDVGKYVSVDGNGNVVYTSKRTTLRTTSKGRIVVNGLWAGTYEIIEVDQPNNNYVIDTTPIKQEITDGKQSKIEVKNYEKPDIKILKVDKKTGQPISNVEFTLQMTSGEQSGRYVYPNNDGEATYSKEAKTLVTNSKGEITINNVVTGRYILTETKNPHSQYQNQQLPISWRGNITATNQPIIIRVENSEDEEPSPEVGDLIIEKVDQSGRPISGIGFTIQMTSGEMNRKYVYPDGNGNAVYQDTPRTVYTDGNGRITINEMLTGTFTITETEYPEKYIPRSITTTGQIVENQTTPATYKIINDETGSLLVHKKDELDRDMSGIGFTIQMSSGQMSGKYVYPDANGNAVYQDTPRTVETDSQGMIQINKMYTGTFTITETKYPAEYVPRLIETTGEIKDNQTEPASYEMVNDYRKGKLEILKIDKDTRKPMSNVGFTLQMTSEEKSGLYLGMDSSGNATYSSTPVTLRTDSSGKITINNVWPGNYKLTETENPYLGYDVVPKVMIENGNISWVEGNQIRETISVTVENEKRWVDISGRVWVDKVTQKISVKNYVYDEGEDVLLNGVTVRLKDANGNIVTNKYGEQMTATTSGNGEYKFSQVLIEELSNYYVEFEYDGLTYQSVPRTGDLYANNTSKAIEGTSARDAFNNNFTYVEGATINTGITRNRNGQKVHDLSYTRNNHTATLQNVVYQDPNSNPLTMTNQGKYMILANTSLAGFNISTAYERQGKPDEIVNVNLGLDLREQPDLAVINDIENVKLTINGNEHIYNYSQRANYNNPTSESSGFNVGVKFGNDYDGMRYRRAIYEADYNYVNPADSSKELKTYITYAITIGNQSTNLTSRVNTLINYYDSSYTLSAIGTGVSNGEVTGQLTQGSDYYLEGYNSEFGRIVINLNRQISSQKSEAVLYIQFELSREDVLQILNQGKVLNNVVDISSYTTFGSDGKVYAGVDQDSNPGNGVPNDKSTFEDDTDYAPGLQLEVADARELTGKVFLDSTRAELQVATERLGNGQYDEGEIGIEGVQVTLTENTGSGQTYTATTNASGDFTITGFIPGDYTLTYTWGNDTYTVQDYKGTIYDKTRYDQNIADTKWYKNNVDTRYTDAIDDYGTRQNIDAEISVNTKTKEYTIHQMNSTTPTMNIGVEYETTYTSSSGDRYTYEVRNIDFGIVERPRQEVELQKRVSSVKVTLANGQVIVDAQMQEDPETGEITATGNTQYLVYRPDMDGIQGFVRVEMDREIIQGATLEVEYLLEVKNNSEIDYDSQNYYLYGIKEGNILTIRTTEVVDYLDKDWPIDLTQNEEGWSIKTVEELKQDVITSDVYEGEYSEISERTILYNTTLGNRALNPGEENSTTLKVSKVLSNSEEIDLENEAEIIEIEQKGRPVPTIPGNYVPGTTPNEPDDDSSELVTVTPPTGENQNYLAITITIVSALVVLVVGIIWIRKKLLKK